MGHSIKYGTPQLSREGETKRLSNILIFIHKYVKYIESEILYMYMHSHTYTYINIQSQVYIYKLHSIVIISGFHGI